MNGTFRRIAIKVGSNVLTNDKGYLNKPVIGHVVEQLIALREKGVEAVLISSGAVAAGRSVLRIPDRFDTISTRQALSSVGQVKLIDAYADFFEKRDYLCAQVLVTKEDFRDRTHYLNMKNCFTALLQNNVIPIVNENDAISITELMFTDNDELAGLIASMINADALFILTNVDGVYQGDPSEKGREIIKEIQTNTVDFSTVISSKKSNFGRGGMVTKCNIARKVSQSGIEVFIANGARDNILLDLMNGRGTGTHFVASRSTSNLKKWIAHSEGFAKGGVRINEGAQKALSSNKATSLLPVGISAVEGQFKKGDIIKIYTGPDQCIGLGMAQYGYEKAKERIGVKNQKPLIHYDYMYLY